MTIDQIKTAADTNIRIKTADNSVTRDEVADLFDNLADEQRDRGIYGVDTTTGLAAVSGANYRKVAVGDTGIFEWSSTGTANGTTIFAASGGGVWILKMAIPKGALAALNSIDYTSGYITNKPALGALALVNSIDYTSGALTNKPTLGALAALGSIDYTSNLITNKPTLGSLAALSSIDYASGSLTNKPDLSTKADLVGGKVPSSQLPSYVDDVLEYANLAALPGTGETGKIYITLDTNATYRWTGSAYVAISSGGGGGALASLNSIDYTSGYLTNKPTLGSLAALSNIDYTAGTIINKPTLGSLAALSSIDYASVYLTNKPTLGSLAALSAIDYTSGNLTNKPTLGSLAALNSIDYTSGALTNKPDLATKQDALVSGTNIKTINSTSLLGSGNINIATTVEIPVYWGAVNAVANSTRLNAIVDIGQEINGRSVTKIGARVITGTGTCTIAVYKYNTGNSTNQLIGTLTSIGTSRVTITSGFTNQSLAEGDYLYFVISAQTTNDIKEIVLNVSIT